MLTKQGNGRNRQIVRVCKLALLTAMCMVFGFIESQIPTMAIAPGVKIGLSNAVALILITKNDFKGAVLVNTARILLSALLFGSPFSLLFSIVAGLGSICISGLMNKSRLFGTVGISVAGATAHNIIQLAVAFFVAGRGVLYYTPVLLMSGAVCGFLVGTVCQKIAKRLK